MLLWNKQGTVNQTRVTRYIYNILQNNYTEVVMEEYKIITGINLFEIYDAS